MEIEEMIKEAQRELTVREMAYPGWVAKGRMGQAMATRRLELQRGIVDALEALMARENTKQAEGVK